MVLTGLFFASIDAHDVTALDLSEASCDLLEKMSARLHADKTRDILRVKVIRAEDIKYRTGKNQGLREIYASMEYETYGDEKAKIQKSRTRAVSGGSNPNWSEEGCDDVHFPTDFLIEDLEIDMLWISVSSEDLGEDSDKSMGSVLFSVKGLQSIVPQPMIPEPTVRDEGREDLYSDYTKLHSVVFWETLEGNISGRIQLQVSLIPQLPFWKKNLPNVRVYKRSVYGLKMEPQVETLEFVRAKTEKLMASEKEAGFSPVETLIVF